MTDLNLRKCDQCGKKFYHKGMSVETEEGLTIEFKKIELRVYSQIKEKSKNMMSNVEFKPSADFCSKKCFMDYMEVKLDDLVDEHSLKETK